MTKTKIKTGFAALILVACMFAGWQTTLLVSVLLLIFCELDENAKNIMVGILAFTAGLALFTLCWSLIVDGIDVVTKSLTGVFDVINGFLDSSDKIDITDLQRYIINPINQITDIADNIVSFLITFAKFGFIIAILTGKAAKKNFISEKINKYVDNFTNYFNKNNATENATNVTQQVNVTNNNFGQMQ